MRDLAREKRSPKPYFHLLDGIRGIASILIVLRHTGQYFGDWEFQESYLAVDVFFVLSGVVIANAYEQRLRSGLSALHFIWIRIVRIYPLYLFGSALMLAALTLGFDVEIDKNHLIPSLILGLLLLPNLGAGATWLFPLNPPAWSLFYELMVNAVYGAIFRILTGRALVMIMTASALGLVAILFFSHGHNLDLGTTRKAVPAAFFRVGYSFFAGVLLYRHFDSKRSKPAIRRHAGLAALAILASVTLLLTAAPPDTLRPYFDFTAIVFLFPSAVYLALWFQPGGLGAIVCRFLGAVSYAVYMIHLPLGILAGGLLARALGIFVSSYAPWSGLCFLAVLLPFCWLVDKAYDGPVRRILRALW